MSISEKAVVDLIRAELRLVTANNGEPCQECGEPLDQTWKVKDGNIEHIAKLVAALPLQQHRETVAPSAALDKIASEFADGAFAQFVGAERANSHYAPIIRELLDAALSAAPPASPLQPHAAPIVDAETVQVLLDLLNPVHGSADKQIMDQVTDERELDAPSDREYNINVTARMERDLTQAVCILEDRKGQFAAAPPAPVQEDRWQPIETAPRNATEIMLRIPKPGHPGFYRVIAHWADGGGDEQPRFRGWFRDTGLGFAEISTDPTGWMPVIVAEKDPQA